TRPDRRQERRYERAGLTCGPAYMREARRVIGGPPLGPLQGSAGSVGVGSGGALNDGRIEGAGFEVGIGEADGSSDGTGDGEPVGVGVGVGVSVGVGVGVGMIDGKTIGRLGGDVGAGVDEGVAFAVGPAVGAGDVAAVSGFVVGVLGVAPRLTTVCSPGRSGTDRPPELTSMLPSLATTVVAPSSPTTASMAEPARTTAAPTGKCTSYRAPGDSARAMRYHMRPADWSMVTTISPSVVCDTT